ncbi:MAG: hypothetical protein HY321_06735 [Armatimonadetes bacterium]|nr:hypothetical protein [Armatimonadota bacterium]
MVQVIREPTAQAQMEQMAEAFDGVMIKLAVDVARGFLAGGSGLHADCEEALLEDGSRQEDVWGADWYPLEGKVAFESLINIRPRQGNFGLEVEDPALRERIEGIARRLLEVG